jgi:lysophospholipase L1-like esterase
MLKRVEDRFSRGQPVRVVAYGDSISEVGRTPGYFGGASCAEMNWAQQLGRMLRDHFAPRQFEILHFAIGGQNAYEGLGRLDWLRPLEPDLVILAFGANDCGYHFLPPDATAMATATMIDGVRARHGADVVVMLPGGDNPKQPTFRHWDETLAGLRKTAEVKNAPLADVRKAILGATDNGAAWEKYHNGPTDCHPNDAGHAVWARAVLQTILKDIDG